MASLTLATLPVGAHTVTATYSGDFNFTTSTGTVNETVAGIQDVTRLVSVTPVPLPLGKRMGKGHTMLRRLRVTNLSGASITGPVYLVLDRLSRGVKLQNATGVSQTHVTPGDPLVLLTPGPLGAGQGVTVTLSFAPAMRKMMMRAVNFNPFVLAGPGVV